ncbi:zf-TFIIB domain-containing protein [Rubellimicrobium roseum]|uniref:Transcription factor zinc-finger domain-containing protein n=1 Tax=Rubellimicrobium roseum TaxID=687525 RepID=A0A5C4N7U5_9RHOB|nr:zf-TFIIB domain-containing protein [Rubellimicrobium roseum]TNC59554.1 hypothetical protein FHG71_22665 [Rubellimicrobium roseum]
MKCPVDGATLVMTERSGVEIDYCPQCRGVWLDRGELDKILERAVPPMQLQEPRRDSHAEPRREPYPEPRREEPRGDYLRSHGHHDDDYYKKKKRKSLLDDIFDF